MEVLTMAKLEKLESWEGVEIPILEIPMKEVEVKEEDPRNEEIEIPKLEVKEEYERRVITKLSQDERYENLVKSMKMTVLKRMYPRCEHPLGELKKEISRNLYNLILCIRNEYVLPTYYILRSTRFFNPIARKIIKRSKKEYIDPNNKWIKIEDQEKIYELLGTLRTQDDWNKVQAAYGTRTNTIGINFTGDLKGTFKDSLTGKGELERVKNILATNRIIY